MFSKKSLLFSFLFYFINSTFCIPRELVELIGDVLPSSEQYKTRICNISISLWAGLCEESFQYLRTSVFEYSNLYVNYALFNEANDKCGPIIIPHSDGSKTHATGLHCYGRPSVVPDNLLPLYYKHSNEIAILPDVKLLPNKVYICIREKDTNIYLTMFWYDLLDLRFVPDSVLNHPPPVSVTIYRLTYSDTAWDILDNPNKLRIENYKNVLFTIGKNEFIKLCAWMFGQERFKNEFIVSSNPADYGRRKSGRGNNYIVIESGDEKEIIVSDMFNCKGQYIGSETIFRRYDLAVDHENDRVILCKGIYNADTVFWLHTAIEIVKNVDKNYLIQAP